MPTKTADKIRQEITSLLKARQALLWIESSEETPAERTIQEAAAAAKYETVFWDCTDGIVTGDGAVIDKAAIAPMACLKKIGEETARRVYVMRDLHRWFAQGDPLLPRKLRTLARKLPTTPLNEARAVVILAPNSEIHPDLQGDAVMIQYPLPNREEIAEILDLVISQQKDVIKNSLTNGTREQAVDAAMGLGREEAARYFARSLVAKKTIDPQLIATEKKRKIANIKGLSWIDPDPGGLHSIGGLENLKKWITLRKQAFGKAAREYGLPAPKGLMLAGVPGCGKSLTAKCLGTAWQIPTIRFDPGAAKSKYVGDTEAQIRKILDIAETIAPCIIWIDEAEKGFAGSQGESADGGVSQNMMGAVLTWMQEKTAPVFVVATANDVDQLPPEMLRKGRFDELFFVDLPTQPERVAILQATMHRYNRQPKSVHLRKVADATDQFSGAELAALIPDAMFAAFNDGAREITTKDVLAAAAATQPLAKSASKKITRIREWAAGHTRPASAQRESGSVAQAPELDV